MRSALALMVMLAACGTIDGHDPYALWRIHEHPEQAFHFHYPAPPFERQQAHSPAHAKLAVEPRWDGVFPADARYRLEVWVTGHAELALAASEESSRLAAYGFEVFEPVARWNRAGDEGIELRGERDDARAQVFLLGGAMGVVAMRITGTGDMDSPDVDLLLDGFEPQGAEER